MTGKRSRVILSAAAALACLPAAAHHSFNAFFDLSVFTEVEGRVTEVDWVNPHIKIYVQSSNGGDTWTVEAGPVALLTRMGIERGVIGVGDRIRARGNPGRGREFELWVSNILMSDGTELLANPAAEPFWGDNTVGESEALFERGELALPADGDRSIFRVWARLISGMPRPQGEPVLNAAGRDAQQPYERGEVEFADCAPDGMPRAMVNPYPIEFVDLGERIMLRVEAYDQERTIHMRAPDTLPPPSLMGYSLGRWEDGVLVVETSRIDYHSYNDLGPAQSEQGRVVERFAMSPDGLEMAYAFTITDPLVLAEPWTYTGAFIYRDDERIEPWNCGV